MTLNTERKKMYISRGRNNTFEVIHLDAYKMNCLLDYESGMISTNLLIEIVAVLILNHLLIQIMTI